jgi:hypothetical protein
MARLLGATLEELYDDRWILPRYVHDVQPKLFAMTADDKVENHLDVTDVDGPRLGVALANLERVHVFGLSERHREILETMGEEHGWTIADLLRNERAHEICGQEPRPRNADAALTLAPAR